MKKVNLKEYTVKFKHPETKTTNHPALWFEVVAKNNSDALKLAEDKLNESNKIAITSSPVFVIENDALTKDRTLSSIYDDFEDEGDYIQTDYLAEFFR